MQTRFERLQAWVGAALCWVCSLVFGFLYYTLYHILYLFVLQGGAKMCWGTFGMLQIFCILHKAGFVALLVDKQTKNAG